MKNLSDENKQVRVKLEIPTIRSPIEGLELPNETDSQYVTEAFFRILEERSFPDVEASKVWTGAYHHNKNDAKMLATVHYVNQGAKDIASKVVANSLRNEDRSLNYSLIENLYRSCEFRHAYAEVVSDKLDLIIKQNGKKI